jgi:ubiquinone biosynthesis protein UbiJ
MLLSLIELACNQALEHDPLSLEKIQRLRGKPVTIKIKDLNRSVTILAQSFGIELQEGESSEASVTLAATPPALLKIARHGMENAELEPGELEINGDPIVAQKFAALISGLNIDWDALLAEHLGEVPASLLNKGVSMAQMAARDGRTFLKSKVNRALVEEMNLVADANSVEHYLEDVDQLRASVDRLEARLKRLLKNDSVA